MLSHILMMAMCMQLFHVLHVHSSLRELSNNGFQNCFVIGLN